MRFPLVLLLVLMSFSLSAQRANKQKAEEFAKEARKAYRAEDYQRAIEYFEKAITNDRRDLDYQLELAQAHFGAKEYVQAIRVVKPLSRSRKARGPEQIEAIRIHASCLDLMSKQKQAIKTLRYGLKSYPNAGELYFEYGLVLLGNGDAIGSLGQFENGVVMDPGFSKNYMLAAQILWKLGNYGWAIVYSEQFLNLERRGDLANEVSTMLFELYQKACPCGVEGCYFDFFPKQGEDEVSGMGGAFQQELGQLYSLALSENESQFSPRLLYLVQLEAISLSAKGDYATATQSYLDWLKLLQKKGHLEAYNYWLMQNGAPLAFGSWLEENEETFKAFEGWFFKRSFLATQRNPIVRPQALKRFAQ